MSTQRATLGGLVRSLARGTSVLLILSSSLSRSFNADVGAQIDETRLGVVGVVGQLVGAGRRRRRRRQSSALRLDGQDVIQAARAISCRQALIVCSLSCSVRGDSRGREQRGHSLRVGSAEQGNAGVGELTMSRADASDGSASDDDDDGDEEDHELEDIANGQVSPRLALRTRRVASHFFPPV